MYVEASQKLMNRLSPLNAQVRLENSPEWSNRLATASDMFLSYVSSDFSLATRQTHNAFFQQVHTVRYLLSLTFRDIRNHEAAFPIIRHADHLLRGFQPMGYQQIPTEGKCYPVNAQFVRLDDEANWLYLYTFAFQLLEKFA